MGPLVYLVRYGVMGHVGRFPAWPDCGPDLERGQAVVLQTDRGVELGEVLILVEETAAPGRSGPTEAAGGGTEDPERADWPRMLRLAGAEDLARSRRAEALRPDRFGLCRRILQEVGWPWDLIDVEPMLDDRATVLHYLGPHRIDSAAVRARFRMSCDFDVLLEPVGTDSEGESEDWEGVDVVANAPRCGDCGCSDGGCGTRSGPEPPIRGAIRGESEGRGCAPAAHSGCDSCGIGRLMAARGDQSTAAAR